MTFPLADHDWPDHHDIKTQSPNTIPLIFCNSAAKLSNYFHSSKHFTKKVRTAEAIRTWEWNIVIVLLCCYQLDLAMLLYYTLHVVWAGEVWWFFRDQAHFLDFVLTFLYKTTLVINHKLILALSNSSRRMSLGGRLCYTIFLTMGTDPAVIAF